MLVLVGSGRRLNCVFCHFFAFHSLFLFLFSVPGKVRKPECCVFRYLKSHAIECQCCFMITCASVICWPGTHHCWACEFSALAVCVQMVFIIERNCHISASASSCALQACSALFRHTSPSLISLPQGRSDSFFVLQWHVGKRHHFC